MGTYCPVKWLVLRITRVCEQEATLALLCFCNVVCCSILVAGKVGNVCALLFGGSLLRVPCNS